MINLRDDFNLIQLAMNIPAKHYYKFYLTSGFSGFNDLFVRWENSYLSLVLWDATLVVPS